MVETTLSTDQMSKSKIAFEAAADKRIRSCLRQIHEMPDVQKVVVYGSYAKGTNRDDSDVDVAVFFSLPQEKMLECYKQLVKICNIPDADIQVQAFPCSELSDPCGIIEEIVTYGVEF